MTSKTSAIFSFLRDLLLGAAVLASLAGVFLLAGKIYVLFQPDPSHFFIQADEIKPGTWIYFMAAAVDAVLWVLQRALVIAIAVTLVMLLRVLGAEIRENWPRR